MMKRVAAVAAISLAAMQVLAGFTSVAMASHDGPGRHLGNKDNTPVPNATASCTVAAGIAIIQDGTGTATVWTDGTYLYCDVDGNLDDDFTTAAPKLADLSSAIIYANENASVFLEQAPAAGANSGTNRPANFGGLKLTVDSGGVLIFDASGLTTYYGGTIVLTDTTFSGQGLVGTIYAADKGEYKGGTGADSFDASAVTADITAVGGAGADTLRSGSGDDSLAGGNGGDKLYGGAGYDTLDCNDSGGTPGNDQCWGGAGDDIISLGGVSGSSGVDIVAPGDGFDNVSSVSAYAVTYVDSTVAIEYDGEYNLVYSDAGDDTLPSSGLYSVTGSSKGDLMYGFYRMNGGAGADVIIGTADVDPDTDGVGDDVLSGGGGKDKIRSLSGEDTVYGDSGADTVRGGPGDDKVYGGGGDDVLYGLGGVDFLKGGTGIDQTWGGAGIDTCSGEVRDSCEFRKG